MQKILSMMLVLLFLCLSLVGCTDEGMPASSTLQMQNGSGEVSPPSDGTEDASLPDEADESSASSSENIPKDDPPADAPLGNSAAQQPAAGNRERVYRVIIPGRQVEDGWNSPTGLIPYTSEALYTYYEEHPAFADYYYDDLVPINFMLGDVWETGRPRRPTALYYGPTMK